MIDTEEKKAAKTKPLFSRLAEKAFGRPKKNGRGGGSAVDGPSTLIWLAGPNYAPREERNTLQPTPSDDREAVDKLLANKRPARPIVAAAQRSALLSELRQLSGTDQRVLTIFDADPIVVEDRSSGIVVTESQLLARKRLFVIIEQLFTGARVEPPQGHQMQDALIEAFPYLNEAARREWSLGEVRRAQLRAYLANTPPEDVATLVKMLIPIHQSRDAWETMRLMTHAAAMAQPSGERYQPVTRLLDA